MAKSKATITVDREKLDEARALLDAPSASAAIDIALTEIIRRGRRRHDVEAYLSKAPDAAIGEAVPDWSDLADDTDWDAAWPRER